MSKCEKCGHENVKDSRFCESCGAELTETPKESADAVTDEMPDKAPENGGKGSSGKKIAAVIIVAICVLAAIVIAVMNMGGNGGASYSDKITEADRYMEEQDYDKAETAYLEAIDIDPKEAEAYIGLSDLYMSQEKSEKAVEILSDGIDNVKDDKVETLEGMRTDAIYEPVKQDYISQLEDLFEAFNEPDPDWEAVHENTDFYYDYFQIVYENGLEDLRENEQFGFAYEDIDGNGTDEMLVFIQDLSAIWTNDGREAICLLRYRKDHYSTDMTIRDDGKLFELVMYGNGINVGVNQDMFLYEFDEEGTGLVELEHYQLVADGENGIATGEWYYVDSEGNRVDEEVVMRSKYGDDYGEDYRTDLSYSDIDEYFDEKYGDYDIEYMFR